MTDPAGDHKEAVLTKAVELTRVSVGPGEILAIIVPPEWTPRHIAQLSQYLWNSKKLAGVKFVVLPHCELAVVKPPGGFEGQ